MSDEIDQLLEGTGEGGGDGGPGDLTGPAAEDVGAVGAVDGAEAGGSRRRLTGLLAMVAGTVGAVLAIVMAAISIRAGFTASDTVETAMQPVVASFDRLDDRIDQTDDLVSDNGIDPDRLGELGARVDGLVDVSTGAHQGFEAIDDHPLYQFLPAELSKLGEALSGFEESAVSIDDALGESTTVSPAVTKRISDELDAMQARVSDVRSLQADAATSLRRWVRFGALLAFLGSLWVLWGQITLARRGWRGFRARPL